MIKKYFSTFQQIIVFSVLLVSFTSKSVAQNLSENAKISILTCDAGNELYSIYGHTGIRIQDPKQNLDLVYNFGYFDFRTPNFYLKFIKGDLQYFAGTTQFADFMAEYVYFQRGVYEQTLNLNQLQKQAILNDLNAILNSEKRFYTYKFIDRNCTTMVVDILNKNLSEKISTQIKDRDKTNRTILYNCIEPLFYSNLGINILFGTKTDTQFDHIYLPLQFLEGISLSKNNGTKLTDNTLVLNKQSFDKIENSFWNGQYLFVLFFIIISIFNNTIVRNIYFIFMACLGFLLIWMGFYSNHNELHSNINIALFNPLYLVLVYLVNRKNKKLALRTIYLITNFLLIYSFLMLLKVHFLMFLPIILTNAILLYRTYLNIKKVQE